SAQSGADSSVDDNDGSKKDSKDTNQVAADVPVTDVDVQGKKDGSADSGYRTDTANVGPLGEQSQQDTPYSVNVTSGELVENTGAHTMADALKTNPTVVATQLPHTWVSIPRMNIRGFEPVCLRDGLYMHSLIPPAVEDVERIEVLNGLSGFLYGFGSLGGSINFVSKEPVTKQLSDFSSGVYGGGVDYLQIDQGGTAGFNDKLSYRVNVYREDGQNYIDEGSQERTLFSSSVNYDISAKSILKARIYHEEYTNRGLQTTFIVNPSAGIKVPDAYDPTKLYSQPWTRVEGKQDMYDLGFESKLNDILTFRTAGRYNHVYRKYNGIYSTLIDNNGDYTETLADFAPQDYDMYSLYSLVDASFDTGEIHHDTTFGFSGYSYLQKTNATSRIYVNLTDTFNVDSPTYISMPDQFAPTAENSHGSQIYESSFMGDRITFNPQWAALVGVNHAQYHYKSERIDTGVVTNDYEQAKNTPSVALIYKPIPLLSTYISYMEGISAGGTAPSTAANAGEMLSPSASTQWETGIKTTIKSIDISLAYFHLNKINEYTDPDDKVYKQDGRQLHKGWELTTSGKVTERLTIVGGLNLLDAEVVQAKNNVAIEGKTPINVPDKEFRVYLEYAVPGISGLIVTTGASYYGKRPVDAKNLAFIEPVTIYDAGLRYQTAIKEHKTTVNLNVLNIFNQYYWAGYLDGCGLMQGDPRTISLSVKIGLK
ncbi:MAG TPA: TonB-dependent siderophore receptor, partial [Firmicutes bacterium]|nr:TonB-dependent siderophore receptor [Bacillota bacterium]